MVEQKTKYNWSFYIHLQNSTNWDLDSYYKINDSNDLMTLLKTNEHIGSEMLKKSLIFVMKNNINPIWEDELNKKGGSFSFKIHNRDIERVWKHFFYRMIGNTLFENEDIMENVNGLSVSPKKTTCILKVWIKTCDIKNPSIFSKLKNIIPIHDCIFKKHI